MDRMTPPRVLALTAAASLGSTAPAASAHALEEIYFGIGALGWENQQDGLEDARSAGGRLTAGALFSPRIGIEAHFGKGGSDTVETRADYREPDVDETDVEVSNLDSVLLRLNAPLMGWFHVYALGGFSAVEVIETPDSPFEEAEEFTESGFSFGVGLEIRTPERYALSIDYVQYISEPGFDVAGASATVKWRF